MKKALALVLAMAMTASMAVTSFAITTDPGKDVEDSKDCVYGETYYEVIPALDGETEAAKDFTVTGKYVKGSDIVKSLSVVKKNVVVTPADSSVAEVRADRYFVEIETTEPATTSKKTLDVDFIIKANTTVKVGTANTEYKKGKEITKVEGIKADFEYSAELVTEGQNYVEEGSYVYEGNSETINSVMLFDDVAEYAVKWNKDEKAKYLGANYELSSDNVKALGLKDSDNVISIEFKAAPSFSNPGALLIKTPSSYKEGFVYEVNASGELVKSDAFTYDAKKGGFTAKTRNLGYYIVADKELEVKEVVDGDKDDTTTDGKDNPDTGANDFVSVAAVMAVVSLAAAGAVAFKKASK